MNAGEELTEGHLLDGRYRVKKVLGVGGMGRVYLSNDTRLANRPVAVKEMVVGDGIQEKKAIEDFTREANVLARLSHPGIPTLIDHFAENSRHYLVMEFVAGGDLQGVLDKLGPKGKVAEDKVLRWARQMLDVLDFLHGQKPPIIYRDLKPGNIMIDKDGRAMLIDFRSGQGAEVGAPDARRARFSARAEAADNLSRFEAGQYHDRQGWPRDADRFRNRALPAAGRTRHPNRLGRLRASRAVHGQGRAALGSLLAGRHDASSADWPRSAARAAVQLSAGARAGARSFGQDG